MLTKNEEEQTSLLFKEGENFRIQIKALDKQLDYFCSESIHNAEEIAMLLDIESDYQNIYRRFRRNEKKLYEEYSTQIKSSLAKINLSYPKKPTPLDLLHFLDASNNLVFSEEKNHLMSELELILAIEINKMNYEFSTKLLKLHLTFYAETNKLFLSTYRKQMDS